MTPAFTLPSSTKLVSVVSVKLNLASVSVNLSLSAPGAFSFVVPCALSNKDVSDADVTILSVTFRPILNDGLPLYFSNTNVCASTFTKKPLIKTPPSLMFAIEERQTKFVSSDSLKTLNSLLFDATDIPPDELTVTSLSSSAALNLTDA